ncbi:MAG: hypothetical protein AAFR09_02440 [Pseudomonadota bacterium]
MNRIAPILILSASLAACGDEPPVTSTEAPVAAEISSKKLTAEQHGKSTVPVFMAYEFLQTPAVGEPLTVRVELARASTIEAGALRVATRGAMTLSKNTPEQMPLKASASSGTDLWTQDIVVTPSDTGRSYVSIQVNGIWEGQPFTKAMSIPVQVGEGGPRLETNGVIIDDGVEVLSSMPADQQLETGDSTR